MRINELNSTLTSNKKRKRRGRGAGSGLGKTAGRGVKVDFNSFILILVTYLLF